MTSHPPHPTLPDDDLPPPEVTREQFLEWRAPRLGTANPDRFTNAVWSWLARRREINAYMANAHFGGPSSFAAGPCWCNARFGQSRTMLADGCAVLIAGEHEDSYDPDFYIYNDVIVVEPSGRVEIYGYSHDVFPPTDFHTATHVGDRVVILGCLGHPAQRAPGVTPVFALDVATLAVTRLTTTGDAPGWIFEHSAELSADARAITVRGGKRIELVGTEQQFRDSIDDWSLDLDRLAWTRLTDRRWPLWEIVRVGGAPNQLQTIGMMSWFVCASSPFAREQLAKMVHELGWCPDFAVYAAHYAPPIAHARLPDDQDAGGTVRIIVDGVTVRYVEELASVQITVEGALAPDTITALVEDARRKLSTLERSPYEARRLRGCPRRDARRARRIIRARPRAQVPLPRSAIFR